MVPVPKFESGTSRIRSRNCNHWTEAFCSQHTAQRLSQTTILGFLQAATLSPIKWFHKISEDGFQELKCVTKLRDNFSLDGYTTHKRAHACVFVVFNSLLVSVFISLFIYLFIYFFLSFLWLLTVSFSLIHFSFFLSLLVCTRERWYTSTILDLGAR
jgi:hypothetical protein